MRARRLFCTKFNSKLLFVAFFDAWDRKTQEDDDYIQVPPFEEKSLSSAQCLAPVSDSIN